MNFITLMQLFVYLNDTVTFMSHMHGGIYISFVRDCRIKYAELFHIHVMVAFICLEIKWFVCFRTEPVILKLIKL